MNKYVKIKWEQLAKMRRERRDRYLAYLSITVGIAGIFVSLVLALLTITSFNMILAIQNTTIIVFLILYIGYLKNKHRVFDSQLLSLSRLSKFIYTINISIINKKNYFRFTYGKGRSCYTNSGTTGDEKKDEINQEMCKQIQHEEDTLLYSNTKDIFRKITDGLRNELLTYYESTGKNLGTDLSVAIRLNCLRKDIEPFTTKPCHLVNNFSTQHNDDIVLVTCWRDEHTFKELNRFKITLYDPALNTPYLSVLENPTPDSFVYYCNNITKHNTSFICQNDNWRKHYNATLVAPIKFNEKHLDNNAAKFSNYLGFVTVDSKNASKLDLFDDDIVQNLVRFVAGELLDMIVAYSKLKRVDSPIVFSGELIKNIISSRAEFEKENDD